MVFLSIWYKGLFPEFWLRGLLFGQGAFSRILVGRPFLVEGAFSKIWVWRDIFLVVGLFQEFWLRGFYFVGGPFPKFLLSETFFGWGAFSRYWVEQAFFWLNAVFGLGAFSRIMGCFSCPILQYLRRPICVRLELLKTSTTST